MIDEELNFLTEPLPFEMDEEKKKCAYIYTRGKKKGENCSVSVRDGQLYCKRHTKEIKKEVGSDFQLENLPQYILDDLNKEEQEEQEVQPAQEEPEEIPIIMKSKKIQVIDEEPEEIIPLPTVAEEQQQEDEENKEEPQIVDVNQDENERLISRYYREIPWLQEVLPIESRGEAQATEWLHQIDMELSSRTSDQIIKWGFNTSTSCVEYFGCKYGMKIQGYSQMLSSNPEVDEILKIIKLRNLSAISEITPEQKLLGIMLMSAVSLHSSQANNQSIDRERVRTNLQRINHL
jgi:hypothetical protein